MSDAIPVFTPGATATPVGTPSGAAEPRPPQPQNSAFAYLEEVFRSYGLTGLASLVQQILLEDFDKPVALQLQRLYDSNEYKQRFPAMEKLREKVAQGLPGYTMISPAEYMALEESYRSQLFTYGLPEGFYDEPADFANWIVGGVSPDEVGRRAQLASEMAMNADAATKDALRQFYGVSDGQIAAYFLDPQRAEGVFTEMERRARAARLAGAAADAGFGVDETWRTRAEQLAGQIDPRMTTTDIRSAYSNIAEDVRVGSGMSARYGLEYTLDDAEDANLLGMASAQRKKRKVAEAEAATFSGDSGLSGSSLSQSKTSSV